MTEIVIWAHSECGSNMALYREVKRHAGIPVTIALWKYGEADDVRIRRESEGQRACEFADLELMPIGDDLEAGRGLLGAHGGKGTVHVFCVYQNSAVWRELILEAKRCGAKVVVSAEAPCEMCVGFKAVLKRMYYRWGLPLKVRNVVKTADLFLNASGNNGVERLVRLGWQKGKIVPFGYANEVRHKSEFRVKSFEFVEARPFRVLHTGIEAEYRGVHVIRKAVEILRSRGVDVELVCTGGRVQRDELERLYGWADVFVACGLCEPWGIRVNDAIHAGMPVVVSDGMGAKWLVEQFGCGAVFPKGNALALASVLERMAKDPSGLGLISAGVKAAHEAWTPKARAEVWLKAVLGQ